MSEQTTKTNGSVKPNVIRRLAKQLTKKTIANKWPNTRKITITSTIKQGSEPVQVLG